jgi:hypothetical protein
MIVHGVRGHQLPEELSNEELEVYGIDWEALHEERILQSQRSNNSASEGGSSWIGQSGPPEHLNEVSVNPPSTVLMHCCHGWIAPMMQISLPFGPMRLDL